jgi:hypothetical protein
MTSHVVDMDEGYAAVKGAHRLNGQIMRPGGHRHNQIA